MREMWNLNYVSNPKIYQIGIITIMLQKNNFYFIRMSNMIDGESINQYLSFEPNIADLAHQF